MRNRDRDEIAHQIALLDDDPICAPFSGGCVIVAQLQLCLGDITQVSFLVFDDHADWDLEGEIVQRRAGLIGGEAEVAASQLQIAAAAIRRGQVGVDQREAGLGNVN